MKLRNIYKFMFATALVTSFVACSDDEDATSERIEKSVVTADLTSFNLNEGQDATITLTIDKPLNKRSDFKLELVGGTGAFRDYTVDGDNNPDTDEETVIDDGYGIIGHKVTFPAYATSASFTISTFIDYLPEGTESLVFRLYPMGNSTSLVDAASETITVNLANVVLDEIQADLTWASRTNAHGNIVDIEYTGTDEDTHSYADFDFDTFIIGPANDLGGATGNHPEYIGIASTAPNGFYDIYVDLWDTTSAEPAVTKQLFKPMLTISKPGAWVHTIDLSGIWSSDDLGSGTGPAADIYAAYIEKAGSTFTLYAPDDSVLATGRAAMTPKNVKPVIVRKK